MKCRKLEITDYFRHLPSGIRTSSKVGEQGVWALSQSPELTCFSPFFDPKSSFFVPEKFYYGKKSYSGFFKVPIDPDGNLLTDGKQSYTWNGENRLIAVGYN